MTHHTEPLTEVPAESSFGALLRRFRHRAGLTQEELAERATLSVRAISELERGARQGPHRTTVALLASALQLPADERAQMESSAQRKRGPWRAAAPELSPAIPAPVTSLIGRERDVVEAVHRVRWGGVRLLTLTGPGGVGKTRVALAVAQSLRDDCPGGPVYVSLASLRDPGLVTTTLAAALGLHDESGKGHDALLVAHLRTRAAILVLDNFEQLLGAASLLARLLLDCPSLKVIVTSRVALKVQGEHRMEIAPLEVPEMGVLGDIETAVRYPAIQLFAQRAQATRRDLVLTTANLATVAEICRALDGLPLAIELAAARMAHLSPSALLMRLSQRLQLLTDGPVDLPPRQQTMAQTIAWSYDLLTEPQQRLLCRLSVFSGGWTLDAAEAICGETEHERALVFGGLGDLIDASLVLLEDGNEDEPRYRMLETIREFAAERLAASEEESLLRRAHATFFAELTERLNPTFYGWRLKESLACLDRELDNLRAALEWSLGDGDPMLGLRITASTSMYWHDRGYATEGRRWTGAFLAAGAGMGTAVRAKATDGAGMLALVQGDVDHARLRMEEGLRLYRELDDEYGIGMALAHLGRLARMHGDLDRATDLLEECIAITRRQDDHPYLTSALTNLGEVRMRQGDYVQARAMLDEALALRKEAGDAIATGQTLNAIARVEQLRGEPTEAIAWYRAALTSFREATSVVWIIEAIEGLAALLADRGEELPAARLWGAAAAIRESSGLPAPSVPGGEDDQHPQSSSHRATGPEWMRAWNEGHDMSLEEAIERALLDAQ